MKYNVWDGNGAWPNYGALSASTITELITAGTGPSNRIGSQIRVLKIQLNLMAFGSYTGSASGTNPKYPRCRMLMWIEKDGVNQTDASMFNSVVTGNSLRGNNMALNPTGRGDRRIVMSKIHYVNEYDATYHNHPMAPTQFFRKWTATFRGKGLLTRFSDSYKGANNHVRWAWCSTGANALQYYRYRTQIWFTDA